MEATVEVSGTERVTVDKGPPWWKSVRYRIAMIGFLGGANIFIQRSNLSMAIVCMVNHTAIELLKHPDGPIFDNSSYLNQTSYILQFVQSNESVGEYQESCDTAMSDRSTTDSENGEFIWSKEKQGILLGALFWGYVPLQILGGYLVKRIGIRHATGPFFLAMSTLTLLSHPAALWSPWALFVLRMLIGCTNAVCLPGIFFILSTWAPPDEKSRMSSILFAGNTFGNVLAFPIAGLLCKYGFAGGWPSVFYVSGISSFILSILWYLFVFDSPLKHPTIHAREKEYLLRKMNMDALTRKKETVPWGQALRSLPVLAVFISHTCLNWGTYLIQTSLPLYMRDVLKFEAASNGLFTMLPHICLVILLLTSGIVFDKISTRYGINISRKSTAIFGLGLPAILFVALSYLDCTNVALAITILSLTFALLSLNFVGLIVNFFDMAPTHGGQLMTFSNTIANTPGILAPYTVTQLTPDNTREEWQTVFFLTSGILAVGALCFVLFSTVNVQKWAISPPPDEIVELNKGQEKT
ncbi:hypothetical protein LOTGIDRAFT_161423 [Lottia gigantea]|uniref:Major facilitator superfamily (MFS) profile domain-containing protein n=1 Tax=Lottia gigantea TaxID=225164 RepID=V4AGC2_LOTGI|nr:hypothetical protein LOTGIDRAFT_161423 [Lottia gigantea]ESO94215.1 hypothetical protein LOTGIDRAFT_161423 [Lottia gigantea]